MHVIDCLPLNETGVEHVRVVGDQLAVHYMEKLAPRPQSTKAQLRTVSAWGEECQADLVRLRYGIVGLGSVGGFIADALVKTGAEDVMLIEFDHLEEHNLDRLNFVTATDIERLKVEALAAYLQPRATAAHCAIEPVVGAVYEDQAFRQALDSYGVRFATLTELAAILGGGP